MKQVDKNILRLVYGISVKSLHLHYFLADGKHSFEEDWREEWREKVSNGSHRHYFPVDGGGSFGEGGREDLGEEVEEL